MPHYSDGTECKVGDQVTGKLFNSGDAPKAGVVISITPGAEFCNAMVQFTEARTVDVDAPDPAPPRMALSVEHAVARTVRGHQHGSSGPAFRLFTCADYTDTKNLTKVS